MKRTPFKKKPYVWKQPVKQKTFNLNKKESRDEEWARIKKDILNPEFIAKGLYSVCEIQLEGCIGSIISLQYAHSKKRDDIAREEPERTRELCEVVRACTICHDIIEHLEEKDGVSGKDQMYAIVLSIIDRRNRRLSRWKKVVA